MNLRVLEINDYGISIGDENGVIAVSPGYMVAHAEAGRSAGRGAEKEPLFGEAAASQSKLHPLSSSSDFWYRLGMEPLHRPLANFRHNADIAWSHLVALAAQADLAGDVIIAAPGNYSHQQLAVLLGLIRQTPLRAAGLVDSALLAGAAQPARSLYLDIHLHQTVLSQLDLVAGQESGELSREAVVSVPTGWIGIADTLAQLITEAFIQQCRFNPLHNARWEQHLYDSLPHWLNQEADADNNLLLDIQTENTLHQARLTRASVVARLQPVYRRILEHLRELPGGLQGRTLLLSERLAALPGIRTALDGLQAPRQVVSTQALMQAALRHQEQITGGAAQQLVTHLQVPIVAVTPNRDRATHILSGVNAFPLGARLILGETGGKLSINSRAPRALAEIDTRGSGAVLLCREPGWLVNGMPATEEQALQAGDVLQYATLTQSLQLIQVQNG